MHPIEFTWYKAIVLITAALALGVGILNIIYFNRIRLNEVKCSEITHGEATTALWLNIALVIFAGVLFFWSLFRLIFTGEPSKDIVHKTYNTFQHSPDPRTYTAATVYASVATPPGAVGSEAINPALVPISTVYPNSAIPIAVGSPGPVSPYPYTSQYTGV